MKIMTATVILASLAYSVIACAQGYNFLHPSIQQHTNQMMEQQSLQQQVQQQTLQQQLEVPLQNPTQQQTIDQILIEQRQHDVQDKLNSYR